MKRYVTLTEVDDVTKGTFQLDEVEVRDFKDEAVFILKVEELTETGGADPITLQVKVQSYFSQADVWKDTVIFDEISATGETISDVQLKVMTIGLGMKQRVVYTLSGSGTVGANKFKVIAEYKDK